MKQPIPVFREKQFVLSKTDEGEDLEALSQFWHRKHLLEQLKGWWTDVSLVGVLRD